MHRSNKIKCVIFCVVLLVFAGSAGGCKSEEEKAQQFTSVDMIPEEEKNEEISSSDEEGVIYVDVCGQVNAPGVYELSEDSRVFEAIEKAGGMTEKAAVSSLNQAEKLCDGQQIYVPSREEVQNTADDRGSAPQQQQTGKININTATKEELMTLNGIGEAKAEAIIRYRSEQGKFHTIEDIKKIEGIKDGVFNKVKDQITV
ncbi:MAG: helix-hairpin-helix domain-containing protein [Lachnospiraceae bacterium]